MLDSNFEKNMLQKLLYIFVAIILILEARQEKGELSIALFVDHLKVGA